MKNALQAAASALLAERGPEALSLREISLAAGVSHAAAYRHYADKQALLADLAEAGFRELLQLHRRAMAQAAAQSGGSPLAQLKACGRAYVRFGVRQPHRLALMFGPAIGDWQAHAGLAAVSDELAGVLADIVEAGQACGELRPGAPAELALAAWSMVHGLALLLVGRRIPGAGDDEAFVKHAMQRCVDLLVEGLQAGPR